MKVSNVISVFGDNEEWIAEDTEKLNRVKLEVEEVENKLKKHECIG